MIKRNTRRDVLDLFHGPTLSQLATISEDGRPWTRYVMSQMDDDMTIRIPTKSTTRKVGEIERDKFVHVLVGRNLFGRDGAYAQIEAQAKLSRDPAELRRFWHDSFRRYFTGPNDPTYVLIQVQPYRIEYWSMMNAENPAVLEEDQITPSGVCWEEEETAEENVEEATC